MTWSKPSPRRRKALPPRRVAARPAIEIVEDRTLLASHLVTVATGTGPGTLYAAINAANGDSSGVDNVIEFDSGVATVQLDPATALPALTSQVTVDGGSGVVIDGAGTSFDGFRFDSTAGASVAQNLTIRDLAGAAIVIRADGVTVRDSTLGEASEPVGRGVLIDGSTSSAASNSIHGNLIGFATGAGVEVSGAQASGNLIFDNRIGTDGTGGNRGNAVGVLISGSPSNQVGVDGANTIGFNTVAGVRITGAGATGNVVQDNLIGAGGAGNPIGIDVSGVGAGAATVVEGNAIDDASTAGVRIAGATGVQVRSNVIGLAGTVPARATVVGVLVDGTAAAISGVVVSGNTIGLTTAGVIVRSAGAALPVGQPARATISGNFLGTDDSGAPLGNGVGVWLDGTSGDVGSVIVGGTTVADRNTIGNSGSAGVRIQGAQAAGNSVEGNLIGFDADGRAMGNPIGVLVVEAGANLVASNRIGNSSTAGVQILDAAAGSVVRSNILGTTLGGAAAANYDGVEVFRSAGNQVGQPGAGNTIGNSTNAGVSIAGAASTDNLVRGNTIGLTPTGVAAPDVYGVQINGAPSNTIGGTAAGDGNVIGHSSVAGVQIAGPSATGNVVAGNRIGVGPGGEDYGNAYGVQVVNSGGNRIGDSAESANVIGRNDVSGVAIFAGSGNVIRYNTYLATNGAPPIAASDINVAAGANGGVQPPSILTASPSGADVRIRFTTPLQAGDVVQVYGFTDAARTYADERTIASDQSEITIPAASLGAATSVVVTVTRASGTSAFSNVVAITSLLVVDTDKVSEAGKTSLWDAINNANSIGGSQTITFNLPVGSIIDASSAPLPAITTPTFVDGPGASSLTIAGGGTSADGLVFTATTDGSRVDGLTFRGFGGAAIRILSAGVTVETSVFDGDALGVALRGAGNQVLNNEFRASTTAGVLIDGAGASGNEVYENTFDSNAVGVLVQNASGNRIGAEGRGNTIRDNAQAGVFIQAGAQNSVVYNLFEGRNGQVPVPTPPVPPPVSDGDVVIPSGGNGGVQPPDLQTASPDGDDILIRFTTPLVDGDVLQIYGYTEDARTFAKQVTIVGETKELRVPKDDLAGVTSIVATVTRSNSSSRFSNLVTLANLLVVDTVAFDHLPGRTSLWDAINNANSISGGEAPKITFALRDDDDDPSNDPTSWTIDVSAHPLPTVARSVKIDGTGDPVTIRGDQDGLLFGLGSGGSTLQNLTFQSFTGTAVRILTTASASPAVAATLVTRVTFDQNTIGVQLLGGGNSVTSSTFTRNGVGMLVQAGDNQVLGNVVTGSTTAGVQIIGATASRNVLYGNTIGQSSGVGVLVVGANGNVIGGDAAGQANDVRNNAQQGIVIQSGRDNSISSNVYAANGPAIDSTFSPANDVVLSPGANEGILPADVLSITDVADGFFIQMFVQPYAGQSGPFLARIQVYQQGTDKVMRPLTPAPRAAGDPYPAGVYMLTPGQVNNVWVRLQAADADLQTAITLTDFATNPVVEDPAGPDSPVDPGVLGNTNAFSALATPTPGNVVVNTADYDTDPDDDPDTEDGETPIPGSLRFAIEFSTEPIIYFRIPAYRANTWTIELKKQLDVNRKVTIDGWDTGTDPIRLADDFIQPVIFLEPSATSDGVGVVFNKGGGGGVLRGLQFTGFDTAVEVKADDVQLLGNVIFGDGMTGVGIQVTEGTRAQIGNLPYEVSVGGQAYRFNPRNVLGGLDRAIVVGTETAAAQNPKAFTNFIVNNQIGVYDFETYSNRLGIEVVDSPNNFIIDNIIGESTVAGVWLRGGKATWNRLAANQIGVASFLPLDQNIGNDVGVRVDAPDNIVGSIANWPGLGADARNLIGKNRVGIVVTAFGNTIAGNYIGTDSQGRNFGNTEAGISVENTPKDDKDKYNLIGATGDQRENVVGWNKIGIRLDHTSHAILANNFVGYSPFAGTPDTSNAGSLLVAGAAVPNEVGIRLDNATKNFIGPEFDPDPAKRRVSALLDNLLDGANLISSNRGSGIELGAGSASNVIRGNLIGRAELKVQRSEGGLVTTTGNVGAGIAIQKAGKNDIGDANASYLIGPSTLTVGLANLILGNQDGVTIDDASKNELIAGNQISQNVRDGVKVSGNLQGGASRIAQIVGNFIGVGFDGTSLTAYERPTGNGLSGVALEAGQGDASKEGFFAVEVTSNLISSNGLNGVGVRRTRNDDVASSSRILIGENIIGLSFNGDSRLATGEAFGNVLDGVRIADVAGVQVGQIRPGGGGWSNVISGNLGRGVEIYWTLKPSTVQNFIFNNLIGTDFSGRVPTETTKAPGNLSDGVFVYGDASTFIVANLIGGNRAAGVNVASTGEAFQGSAWIGANWIGTGPTGVVASNGSEGVFLTLLRAAGYGRVQVVDNVIGANRANGIHVQDSQYVAIRGNRIGDYGKMLAPDDQTALAGNYSNGVFINTSSYVLVGYRPDAVGARTPGQDGNTISGNRGSGVVISGTGDGASEANEIAANRIGADLEGVKAVANYNSGILISGSSGNLIDDNVISGNRLYGVVVSGSRNTEGGPASLAEQNRIVRNSIGVGAGGATLANSADGVFILNAAANWIGGGRGDRNVISGNDGQGIRIFGAASRGNVISANLVGLAADGATRLPNKGNGVTVDNAGPNTIGSQDVASRNVISGNGQSGIQISSTDGGSAGTWIVGNTIGLDENGTSAVANGANGVFLFGASGVEVSGNVVSGNSFDGVQIFSPSPSSKANSNRVYFNKIGTDPTGSNSGTAERPLGNQGNGVSIINGFGNLVGFGDDPQFLPEGGGVPSDALRNVVSGNANGVVVDMQAGYGGSPNPASLGSPNQISGNFIGLDATGKVNLGNKYAGVLLNNADGTVVGYAGGFTGPEADRRLPADSVIPAPGLASNVVSGNLQVGVHLTGTTAHAKIRGNYIGTDVDGRTYDAAGRGLDLSSSLAAVLVDSGARDNWIGGVAPDESVAVAGTGNLITQSRTRTVSDSPLVGVRINSIGAVGNHIQSNVIGLDATGSSGSNQIGVLLDNATDTTIGGAGAARNVITGNSVAGVEISGPLATRDTLFNNYIGTHANGTTRPAPRDPSGYPGYDPSQADGVLILQSSGNSVGSPGLGNLISGNGNGVNIASIDSDAPAASANYVVGNTIGTDASGMKPVPNFRAGVFITAAPNNQVVGNLISANGLAGIQIFGGRGQQGGQGNAAPLGTTIVGNTIGLNAAGQVDFSPSNGSAQIHSASDFPAVRLPDGITINLNAQQHGVVVIGASGNQIGLPGAQNRNTISGNTLTGVYVSKLDNALQSYATPVDNVVQNNSLRTNGIYGVFRYDAPNNPALESPSANANDFTGTPIPIGDFITGLNTQTPNNPAQSALLGNAPTTPTQPGRGRHRRPRATAPAAVTPARPAAIRRPGLALAARVRAR
ncbi:MAG: hypothetical protein BGO49_20480 [Planctomycetales bacterium 71-10]|nr:MAG: hypothetical protein BGO49_20480 [Planctomycetales bacterium 71-10]